MWVIIWLQVYAWVEVLDRCLALVPGWLDLPISPTRFLLSTLLSTLGIGEYTAEYIAEHHCGWLHARHRVALCRPLPIAYCCRRLRSVAGVGPFASTAGLTDQRQPRADNHVHVRCCRIPYK